MTDDLISRRVAIDAVKSREIWLSFSGRESKISIADKVRDQTTKAILETLADLPDAQPGWIPCKEKLPNGQTEVIVSCHDDSGDTPFDYTSWGWMTTDGEYWIVDNEINNFVVAWLPFPESYKEEKK